MRARLADGQTHGQALDRLPQVRPDHQVCAEAEKPAADYVADEVCDQRVGPRAQSRYDKPCDPIRDESQAINPRDVPVPVPRRGAEAISDY